MKGATTISAFVEYLEHLGDFYGIPKGLTGILSEMFKVALEDKQTGYNCLYINKALKLQIANQNKVSLSRVNHATTDYVKAGYLLRVTVATYIFEPKLFGSYKQREMLLTSEEIKAVYDYGNRTVQVEIG